jgi:hypothetical protein
MTLLFGDYTSGHTPDSQSYATQVYGGPGQQHSVGTVNGGNEDNTIASKYISNCPTMSGGTRRRKRAGRKTRKQLKKGGLNKTQMKKLATKVLRNEIKKKGGNSLVDAAKGVANKVVSGLKTAKNAVENSAKDVKIATQKAFKKATESTGGVKLRKTLKNELHKELKKQMKI